MGRRLIVYLILIMAATLPKVLFSAEDSSTPILKFFEGKCESALNGVSVYDYKGKDGIIRASWLNNNTLLIECFTVNYCGGVKFSGSFELKDDSLLLKYKARVGSEITHCICFNTLNYELLNMPKKNYKIILKEENKSRR
jgi:hypothetical protein